MPAGVSTVAGPSMSCSSFGKPLTGPSPLLVCKTKIHLLVPRRLPRVSNPAEARSHSLAPQVMPLRAPALSQQLWMVLVSFRGSWARLRSTS